MVPLDSEGQLDIKVLEKLLQQYAGGHLLIGSFSAAPMSQAFGRMLSGSLSVEAVWRTEFLDYAAAAPYVRIRMNGVLTRLA